MRVVITGATGFLGRALASCLTAEGVDTVCVARRAAKAAVQVKNYSEAPDGDVLVHLAEASDRRLAEELGESYEREGVQTLRALLRKGYRHVLYASSAALYGDRSAAPHSTDDPVCLVDTYTRLKRACEQEVLARGGTVLRLANLYGPGMSDANVLSAILRQLPLEGPVRLTDTGPVRDFLWIGDAARAFAMMAGQQRPGLFNIGSGHGTSILELARIVLRAAGQPDRAAESVRERTTSSKLVLDIGQTTATFGWRPTMPLLQGIEALIKLESN